MEPDSDNKILRPQKQRFETDVRDLRHKVSSLLNQAIKKVGLALHVLLEVRYREYCCPNRRVGRGILRIGQTVMPDDGLKARSQWERAVEQLHANQCENFVFRTGLRVDLGLKNRFRRVTDSGASDYYDGRHASNAATA